MKTPAKPTKLQPKPLQPEFVLRAQRALRRAARNVREENRRLGLPLLVWGDGKVVKVSLG